MTRSWSDSSNGHQYVCPPHYHKRQMNHPPSPPSVDTPEVSKVIQVSSGVSLTHPSVSSSSELGRGSMPRYRCVCVNVRMCLCVCVHVCECAHLFACACACVCMRMCPVCAYVRMCMCVCLCSPPAGCGWSSVGVPGSRTPPLRTATAGTPAAPAWGWRPPLDGR